MRVLARFTSALIVAAVFATVVADAGCGVGWYIVKNAGSIPRFPADADFLDAHSCLYIDKESAESGERIIYLTFDAGYENGNVEKILDTLRDNKVKAAFFILSNLINKNAELVIRMFDEGHLVCNHTMNHIRVPTASSEKIEENLKSLEDECYEKTGRRMSSYFRYPEGVYSRESVLTLEEAGYTTIFWSAAYADWDNAKQPSSDSAISTLIKQTHPGAVVLLHPTSDTNASILGHMIGVWRDMGYRFGTLDELKMRNQ